MQIQEFCLVSMDFFPSICGLVKVKGSGAFLTSPHLLSMPGSCIFPMVLGSPICDSLLTYQRRVLLMGLSFTSHYSCRGKCRNARSRIVLFFLILLLIPSHLPPSSIFLTFPETIGKKNSYTPKGLVLEDHGEQCERIYLGHAVWLSTYLYTLPSSQPN